MKLNFNNFSIKIKIVSIIILVTIIALVLAGTIFFAYDKKQFEKRTINDLSILAQVIGNNSTAAITYNDPETAREILSSLVAEKQIKYAAIILKDNDTLATYKKNIKFTPKKLNTLNDTNYFHDDNLMMQKSIIIKSTILLDELQSNLV
jgi:uncharacterized membrane protein affecting hemolysin expression